MGLILTLVGAFKVAMVIRRDLLNIDDMSNAVSLRSEQSEWK